MRDQQSDKANSSERSIKRNSQIEANKSNPRRGQGRDGGQTGSQSNEGGARGREMHDRQAQSRSTRNERAGEKS
jgi:hypothetical protein